MDDERMRRRLEAADGPARPSRAFTEDLYTQLTNELNLYDETPRAAEAQASSDRARASVAARRSADRGGWWMPFAAAAALLLLTGAVGAGAIARWFNPPPSSPPGPADGVVRIAVRPDSPQVGASGTAFGGFDVDVADELGRRLGRAVRLVILSPQEMAAAVDSWDIALPSASRLRLRESGNGVAATRPYYWWPSFLVVRENRPATLEALARAKVCVVSGSDGQAWATGAVRTADSAWVPAPQGLVVTAHADDRACLDALAAGEVDAAVTATMTASDVSSRAGIMRVDDGPVALEARGALVRDTGEDQHLGVLVEEALDAMRADGTLSDFATRRFGGDDLSASPAP